MTEHDGKEYRLNDDQLAAYKGAYQKAFAPLAPPSSCPIGWQPNALEPVFYGVLRPRVGLLAVSSTWRSPLGKRSRCY